MNEALENTLRIKYLLGQATEEESLQVEESYFQSPDYHESMLALEEELIRQYLKLELTPQQSAQFESHFLATERRQKKFENTRNLIEHINHAHPAIAPDLPGLGAPAAKTEKAAEAKKKGAMMPADGLAQLRPFDAIYFGAVGDPACDNLRRELRPEQAILGLAARVHARDGDLRIVGRLGEDVEEVADIVAFLGSLTGGVPANYSPPEPFPDGK